jgi:hypothetical protein
MVILRPSFHLALIILKKLEIMRKFIIITSAIILTLIISLLITNQVIDRSIKTEIVINAPAEEVWNVLMDHEAYPQWNPFIKQISGSTQKGKNLAVTIQSKGNDPMDFEPTVLINKKEREFRWAGKLLVTGVFDGEHYFILEQIGPNKTRFIQGENFTGILSGVFMKMIGKDTKGGFIAMNKALKKEVESHYVASTMLPPFILTSNTLR